MTNSDTHEDGLDPLAFSLASQRLNEAKEAIFASEWSEKQQEMLADFAEAAADMLEMVKAAYLNRATPPQAEGDQP